MTKQEPIPLSQAFVRVGTPMFSAVEDLLKSNDDLTDARRRDLISGLRRLAKALGLPTSEVPCDARWLEPRLAKIAPASLGMTAKSWQNIVSDVRSAMAHVGIVERQHNRFQDLAPEWQSLWKTVLESNDKSIMPALQRFVYFLSRAEIDPLSVSDEHALAYRDALECNEISKSPEVAYRAAVNGWNLAVERIPSWPRQRISLPSRQVVIKLPLGDFPTTFQNSLQDLTQRLSTVDPFSEHGRTKALRPATVDQYRRQIIRFASELVHSGVSSEAIERIDILFDPSMAERGLRQMLSRTGNKTTRLISEIAALLRNLARMYEAPEEQRKELANLASRVAVKPQTSMTRKNRDRLRVLQDETKQMELLSLPERIFSSPIDVARRHTSLLAREDAVAIAIFLVCPIRAKNLAGLHLERHLQRPGDGRVYLVLDDQETKNERPVEFELPQDVVRLIKLHLATRCPELCPSGTPWLFPRRDGSGPIDPNPLSSRLKKRIRKETGLEVNAHLFRHFAVMTWLDANPGGYEVARRLLGHSELSHTINMYSGLEARPATRAFADLIAAKKGGGQ